MTPETGNQSGEDKEKALVANLIKSFEELLTIKGVSGEFTSLSAPDLQRRFAEIEARKAQISNIIMQLRTRRVPNFDLLLLNSFIEIAPTLPITARKLVMGLLADGYALKSE